LGQNVRLFFDRLWESAEVLEPELCALSESMFRILVGHENEVWTGFKAQKTIQDRSKIYFEYTKRKSKYIYPNQ
jgi:hypothetical protein